MKTSLHLLATASAALLLAACNNNDNGFNNAAQAGSASSAPAVASAPATTGGTDAAAAGKAFLEANRNASGVQTTASGLQYRAVKEGSGKQPSASDVVTVEYEGRLIDGTVFDSTAKHGGTPVSFPLSGVIPGWTEGLQLMKEGAEYTLFIPAELAYGEQGVPGAIPPNSTLVFDVKLVKVGE